MDIEILKNPVVIWFFIGFAMFLLEMIAPGLIILFFGVGAWIVALIRYFADISLNAQLFIFIVSSILCLVLLRNHLQRAFHGYVSDNRKMDKNMDEYTGQKAVVKDRVSPEKNGKVEFHGTLWEAEADETIEAETTVVIVKKENITLKVKKP